MFRKFLIGAAAALASIFALVPPAVAAQFDVKGLKTEPFAIFTVNIPTTAAINDFSGPIPSCASMTVIWERGNSAVVSMYPASSTDDTQAEIAANTRINQFTTSARYGPFTPTKQYVRFIVDTVNSSVPSSAKVFCSNFAGTTGSGGIQVITQAELVNAGQNQYIYQVTDGTTATDCATGTPGSTVAYCGWNGSAYVAIGIAGGTDNLGNHTATTTLDLASNSMTNVGITTFNNNVNAFPLPDTRAATSPTHVIRNWLKSWFNIDGQKSPVEGEGGGIAKTKTMGLELETTNLTKSEHYGLFGTVRGGGDSDLVGFNLDLFPTGGAQALGDEGATNWRSYNQDYWLTAVGTVGAAVTSGAGTQTVAIANTTESESAMLGENKWMVFTGSAVAVDVADVPSGSINSSGQYDSGNVDSTWVSTGTSGQGAITLVAGQAATVPGLASTGFCIASADSTYKDNIGTDTLVWLPIKTVAGEVITPRWQNQGYDAGLPFKYIISEGNDEAFIAPCARIDQPNFTTGSDYVADTITLIKGAGFPGVLTNAAYTVASYPTIRQSGGIAIMANKLGSMYGMTGYTAANLLDGGFLSSRYQGRAAFSPTFSGDVATLQDGTHHAWLYGFDCGDPGGCETGMRWVGSPGAISEQPFMLKFDATRWSNDETFNLLRFYGNTGSPSLAIKPSVGLGQMVSGVIDPFLRSSQINSTVGDVYSVGDCTAADCFSSSGPGTTLYSLVNFSIVLDSDGNGNNVFNIRNDALASVFSVAESGAVTTTGEQFVDALGFEFESGSLLTNCTTFASGAGFYYDSTNGKFKKCQGGVLSDLDTGGNIATDTLWAAAGDLAYASGNDAGAILGIGSAGQVLRVAAGLPAWGDLDPDFVVNDAVNDDFLDVAAGGTGTGSFTSNALIKGAGTGDLVASGVTVDGSNNVDGIGTADFDGAVSAPSFSAEDNTTEPGNLVQLLDNDTAFTNDPTCANSGVAGTFTVIDKDETASDNWVVCNGTSELGNFSKFTDLDVAETITADWVNTANPWADNEVADNITASNYLPLAGGTVTGNAVIGTTGTLRPTGSGVVEATEVDVAAGAAPTANGAILYDSTANDLEYGDNGTNRKVANLDEAQTFTNKTLASPTFTGTVAGANTIPSSVIDTEVRTILWRPDELEVDGTNCTAPASVTLGSGPKLKTIKCGDNDASTIYGSVKMPDSFKSGTTIVIGVSETQSATDFGNLNADVAAMCVSNGGTIGSTWGTEIALDAPTGVGGDLIVDSYTSAAVTPSGTCGPGAMLFWRYQVDAAGTDAAMATVHFLGFKLEYTSNVGD